jgi:membrane protein implicated in regulation of membrane protease activity
MTGAGEYRSTTHSADEPLEKGVELEVTDTGGATLIVRPFSALETA